MSDNDAAAQPADNRIEQFLVSDLAQKLITAAVQNAVYRAALNTRPELREKVDAALSSEPLVALRNECNSARSQAIQAMARGDLPQAFELIDGLLRKTNPV